MSRIEESACKKFKDDLMGPVQFVQMSKKNTQKKKEKKLRCTLWFYYTHTLDFYLSPFSCEEYSLA